MFTKTILATAAAAVISVSAMGFTSSAAEAHYDGYRNGYYETEAVSIPKTIYETFYKTIIAGYDECYEPIYKRVAYKAPRTIYVTEYVKVFVPYGEGYDDGYSSEGY